MAKVTKKTIKKLKKTEESRALSELDMLKLSIASKEFEVAELKLANTNLQKSVLILQLDKQIITESDCKNSAFEKRKKITENIKKEFNITSEQWGYDPITGEIKE